VPVVRVPAVEDVVRFNDDDEDILVINVLVGSKNIVWTPSVVAQL
jgi:hypothetical protein